MKVPLILDIFKNIYIIFFIKDEMFKILNSLSCFFNFLSLEFQTYLETITGLEMLEMIQNSL